MTVRVSTKKLNPLRGTHEPRLTATSWWHFGLRELARRSAPALARRVFTYHGAALARAGA